MEKILNYVLENRLFVIIIACLLISTGIWTLSQLPVDAFPDTSSIQVQINTVAPALNPEEMEQQITYPIELAISGLPGLKSVRSISKFGLSQVVAVFRDGTSITDARQYVSERLVSVELPNEFERPQLGPISSGLGEIFHYTLSSNKPGRTLEQLRSIHDWIVKPQLRQVSGVAEINSWGGYERQYHLIVSPPALLKYQLTLNNVFEALEKNNSNVGGGIITSAGQGILLRGIGRVQSIEEIGQIVLTSVNGTPVHIKDIAKSIKIGYEIRRGAVTAQGKGEVVLGLAFMLMGENGKLVTENLKKQLVNVKRSLPEDVIIDVVYDRTELTTEVIKTVKHNLFAGAILVVLVLLLLLGNLRAGLLVALVIPLSMILTAIGMSHFAIAASLLSLGAIDFGIIVDGAVVMTESNLRAISERCSKLGRTLTPEEHLETILRSCKQVFRPIIFGMAIILVVFIPVLTLEGTEGKMFNPMAWTFIFALAGALLIALFLTPILNYYFLPKKINSTENKVTIYIEKFYRWCLKFTLRFKKAMFLGLLTIIAVTGWIAAQLGGEFIPKLNEGAIVINTIRLAGIDINESTRYNTRIEKLLLDEFPNEIKAVWSRIGAAEVATDPMGTELTDIFFSLKPVENWTKAKSQDELVSLMQKSIADLPGLNMVFTQPIEMRLNEMESGIRSDIGIKIYGDDFNELIRISDEVQKILLPMQGQSDIAVDQITGQPTLQIKVDQIAISRYGLDTSQVLNVIGAVGGRKVGEIFEGQRKYPLVVRLPNTHRLDSEVLANTIILTGAGEQIPLKYLAKITRVDGSATINREWGRRLIRVQCNVKNRDVASFVAEAKTRIKDNLILPEGYVIDWGGQFENLERARLRLMIVVPVVLILVFFLLYLSLNQLRDVLMIYTGIPFALIGGVCALWFRGIPFSVSAAVGFIALIGIAVLNGQILVSAIQLYLKEGNDLLNSVTLGATQRLRPVLATAITDAVGFIPMAISTGIGAEVQKPLATVVIGGVITSTFLTLVMLPALYVTFGKKPMLEPDIKQ